MSQATFQPALDPAVADEAATRPELAALGELVTGAVAGTWNGVPAPVGEPEAADGFEFVRALAPVLQDMAFTSSDEPDELGLGPAPGFTGVNAALLDEVGCRRLMELVERFAGSPDTGTATVRTAEARACVADTWFSWSGGLGPDAWFGYRVESPVLCVEFGCLLREPGSAGLSRRSA